MEFEEYQLPTALKSKSSDNKIARFLHWLGSTDMQKIVDKEKEMGELLKTMREDLSEEDIDRLAIMAATGKVRAAKIPDFLTEDTVGLFIRAVDRRILTAIYTLMTSSLYYEVLDNKLSLGKAKKKLRELAPTVYRSAISKQYLPFTLTFGNSLEKAYESGLQKVPKGLQNILDNPNSLVSNFATFFAQTKINRKM